MAYESTVSGRDEIYVERYPELGNRQQISTGGGHLPLWSRDGRELFFSSLDSRQMLAVPVQSGTTLVAGRPQVLFEFAMLRLEAVARPYDIAPDGRFLIIREWPGGSRRRHGVEHDRRAELVRGAEAPRADEIAKGVSHWIAANPPRRASSAANHAAPSLRRNTPLHRKTVPCDRLRRLWMPTTHPDDFSHWPTLPAGGRGVNSQSPSPRGASSSTMPARTPWPGLVRTHFWRVAAERRIERGLVPPATPEPRVGAIAMHVARAER